MSISHDDGHGHSNPASEDAREWRRILWFSLFVNAAMFVIEMWAGISAGSSALQANALDFFGDSVNYGISLSVISLAVVWQTRAALFKGGTLIALALGVFIASVWNIYIGTVPEVSTMGAVGFLGLVANVGVAVALYRFRNGDANMKSVWLCTRNDALGNVAVLLAAVGVFGTATIWPDFIVAVIRAYLGFSAGLQTLQKAIRERRDHKAA